VSAAKVLTDADAEGMPTGVANRQVEAVLEGLSANYEGLDALEDAAFSPLVMVTSPSYIAGWLVPLMAVAASLAAKSLVHTTAGKEAARRRRRACGRAVRRIRGIASKDARDRNEFITAAMKQYIGERFDRIAGTLTADECRKIVLETTGDAAAADGFAAIVAAGEAVRYSPGLSGAAENPVVEAEKAVREVEKKAGKCGR
jgi:hypothetical protein